MRALSLDSLLVPLRIFVAESQRFCKTLLSLLSGQLQL